jgi:hypothetical protein
MAIIDSPYPRVADVGPRILEIRTQLNIGPWNTGPLDTALKALTDDNGNQVLPDGHTTSEDAFQQAFETRPQVMEDCLRLYENEFKQFAVTVP